MSMKLEGLRPAKGATKKRKRVGRGTASGSGKTCGRGTKGQKSRSGASIPALFEGGQMPIHMRLPKLKGFKSRNRVEYQEVNVGSLDGFKDGSTVRGEELVSSGLIKKADRPVKILGGGELKASLTVVADAFTASAEAKITAAGGTAEKL